MTSWHIWGLCVGLEHALLMARVIIMKGLPNTPGWIEDARRQLDWYRENMKPGLQIQKEQEHQQIFDERYGVGDEDAPEKQAKMTKAEKKQAEKDVALLTQGNIFRRMQQHGFNFQDQEDDDGQPLDLRFLKMTNPIGSLDGDEDEDEADSKQTQDEDGDGEEAADTERSDGSTDGGGSGSRTMEQEVSSKPRSGSSVVRLPGVPSYGTTQQQ